MPALESEDFFNKYEKISAMIKPVPKAVVGAITEKMQDIREKGAEKAEAPQIEVFRKIVQDDMLEAGKQAMEIAQYMTQKNVELAAIAEKSGKDSDAFKDANADMQAVAISAIQDHVDTIGDMIKKLSSQESSINIAKKKILAKQYNDLRNAAVESLGIKPHGGTIEL